MDEIIARFVGELTGRVRGPFSFRFFLQPVMASIFALRALLQDGWKDIAKVFIFAILLDTVYQLIQLRGIYPLQGLIVAFVLACLPYLVLRGAVRRIAAWWMHR